MKLQDVKQQLDRIESRLDSQAFRPMSVPEAAKYLGVATQSLYGLMCKGSIPYYKPNGKKAYFDKLDLDEWVKHHRVKSRTEVARDIADQ